MVTLFIIVVAIVADRYIESLDPPEKQRLMDESERLQLPEKAFNLCCQHPARNTFTTFNVLYNFAKRVALYEPKLKEFVADKNYRFAVDMLAQLGVVNQMYLYSVVLPAMFNLLPSDRCGLQSYLSENLSVANQLWSIINLMEFQPTDFESLVQKNGFSGLPAVRLNVSEMDIAATKRWLNKNVMKLGQLKLNGLQQLHKVCFFRSRSQISTKVFWQNITKYVPQNDSQLHHLILLRLINLNLWNDARALIQQYDFDCRLLSESDQKIIFSTDHDRNTFKSAPTTEVKYELITTPSQFSHMMARLKGHKIIAIAVRYTDGHYLSLLQLKIADTIFIIDVIVGQFSPDLWNQLDVILSETELIIIPSKVHWDCIHSIMPLQKKVLYVAAFFDFLKTWPERSLLKDNGLKSRTMYRVTSYLLGSTFDEDRNCKFTVWDLRPLLPESLEFAAEQVAKLWDCFTKLKHKLQNRRLSLESAIMNYFGKSKIQVDFSLDLDYSELDIVFG